MLLGVLVEAPHAARPRVLVATTNFETGLLASVAITPPRRVRRLRTDVHSDAVVRVTGGHTIVLNRFLADNVQVLSRRLRTRLQCPVGAGANPHDIVAVSPDKAYVTRYGARDVWIVDPSARRCKRFKRGTIDLGAQADADGLPEMDQMAVVGTRLFISLQRLDRGRGFVPTGPSRLVVVDTTTDAIETVITLRGRNAFGDASGIVREPGGERLAVSTPGDLYAVDDDAGVEWVNPTTLASDGFLLRERDVDGNVTDFVLLSATQGYAIVQGRDLTNRVVRFDPSTGAIVGTPVLSRQGFLPDIATVGDRVWIADQTRPTYGIHVLDPATDTIETKRPIDVGLPPFSMGVLP